MATATLDGAAIRDEASFHAASRAAFGFNDHVAATMDSWIDALSYLRDDEGMTKFRLKPNEVLEIVVANAAAMKAAVPDLLDEIAFCIGGINERYEDYGEKPALKLVLK
ncbi:barstar family protein [Pseudoduganella umbonata]|uniref:Barnase inhibitor n=1 Tax=Pseudoduganella umbonata TaxID=864828 RepID=A0A4P8HQM8_9BURK|nr:barstar family protein [Pseudoduganella umbonata]MBB3220352.1 RNAse (barnase) inhibitor barstar [Pseudoduganella umbonata]QCP12109.1 barnase inhibitor [Pseudoduganella umbonata]